MPEPVNTEGPRGTLGCACVSRDAVACFELRYGHVRDREDICECLCHNPKYDDEEDA